ncbi:MAG: ABC transporter ATP-binding protein [Salinisphaera sp.]|nr:ABC transporter ATP-binding protein [Salinisphaera sp.]
MSGLQVAIQEKRFDTHGAILRELKFSADAGEFIAVVGPSGAGKSTLLSLIAGLDQEFAGSVCWDGAPLYAPGQSPARLGMMFQEPRLMPWMTLRNNINLVLPDADPARVQALLADVGLDEWLDAFPGQLSGGMQRRAALARAFAVGPRLLLMDEPFVSLDMPTGNRLRGELITLWRRERPLVLFVTHDLREALAMADRVLFLSSAPARVVLDQQIRLKRPRALEGKEVAALQGQLLAEHPELLSGLIGGGVRVAEGGAG